MSHGVTLGDQFPRHPKSPQSYLVRMCFNGSPKSRASNTDPQQVIEDLETACCLLNVLALDLVNLLLDILEWWLHVVNSEA